MILLRTYTDRELVSALKKGDERAFNELFRRYWDKAFSNAYTKVKTKEGAEEIVQEIFTDLWSRRYSIEINSFSNFLFASIKYQALNKIRSQIVQQKYWDYYKAFIPQAENTTEKTIHYRDLLQTIDERLDHLPQKTKNIFYMNRLEGKSLKEIADILKLSEKAIEYHLNRSLKELKVYLRNTLFLLLYLFLN